MKSEIVDLLKSFVKANGMTAGLSQEQHTAIVRDAICELVFTDYAKESLLSAPAQPADPEAREAGVLYAEEIKRTRAELYTLLYPLMNGSALRQRMEAAGILAKSEGGRKAADAAALANKYA